MKYRQEIITKLTAVAVAGVMATGAFAGGPIDDPIPGPIDPGTIHVQLHSVVDGMTAPNWGASAPGDAANRLFVTDQDGILWAVDLDNGTKSVFLDVSDRLVELGIGGPGTFDERGLLGVAFHPDYQKNGLLYTYESHPFTGTPADFSTMPMGTDPNHQTVISEWVVPDPGNPASVVDPNSDRELLRIDQPQFNHDGGAMTFGPDGRLYISLGDGGAGDDQGVGHSPQGNGLDTTNILGTVIRIDPLGSNSANGEYGIPLDNPFMGMPGDDVKEIFTWGLRNPFRFSFDMMTGDMIIADVGQNDIEEINRMDFPFPVAGDNLEGANYGWRCKEGTFFFDPNGTDPGFVTNDPPHEVPPGLVDPIAQYDHDEGIAIVGGFVYRGSKIPSLQGLYVFGEFAQTFDNDGRLFHLNDDDEIREFPLVGVNDLELSVLGFGQDANGEVYVLGNMTGVPFDDTGVVLKIATKPGDINADGVVNTEDLLGLLAAWGDCPGCPEDIDDDGIVGTADLLELLANWG